MIWKTDFQHISNHIRLQNNHKDAIHCSFSHVEFGEVIISIAKTFHSFDLHIQPQTPSWGYVNFADRDKLNVICC